MITYGTGPTVRSWHRSPDGTVSGILDNVDPTGLITADDREAYGELIADAAGTHLRRFHDITVTRFSIDHTAVVTLHTS